MTGLVVKSCAIERKERRWDVKEERKLNSQPFLKCRRSTQGIG